MFLASMFLSEKSTSPRAKVKLRVASRYPCNVQDPIHLPLRGTVLMFLSLVLIFLKRYMKHHEEIEGNTSENVLSLLSPLFQG